MNFYEKTLHVRENIDLHLVKTEDAKELFNVTRENNAHLRQWLPWLDDDKNVEDVERYIRGSLERCENQEGMDWVIWENEKMIGGVALFPLDMHHMKTSIMYWLTESHQGKGIMTEALTKIIEYVFEELQLHRIEICCAIGNDRSAALPKKLGFTFEGIARESEWLYDHFVDLEIYNLLATDWHK